MYALKSFRDANRNIVVPGDKIDTGKLHKKVVESYEKRGMIGKKKPKVINTARERTMPKPEETKPAKPEETKTGKKG